MNHIYLQYSTLVETAKAIKARQISAPELTRAMLDRVTRLEPQLHAYATVTSDLDLQQAAQAEHEMTPGKYLDPLHGIPIAIKGICNTKGVATAAGMIAPLPVATLPSEPNRHFGQRE
jgi:amidase